MGNGRLGESHQSANRKPPRWQEGRVHQFRFTVEVDGPETEAGRQADSGVTSLSSTAVDPSVLDTSSCIPPPG